MGLDAAGLSTLQTSFETYLDARNFIDARATLAKLKVRLALMPNTEHANWKSIIALDDQELSAVESAYQTSQGKTLVHAALRRKTRSAREDGT